jgi:hypothetical protein
MSTRPKQLLATLAEKVIAPAEGKAKVLQDRRRAFEAELTKPLPAAWSIDELEACFVVKDGTGQKLAYVYFEEEPGWRSTAKLLTRDEAQLTSS